VTEIADMMFPKMLIEILLKGIVWRGMNYVNNTQVKRVIASAA
jgi:hypothetical protein